MASFVVTSGINCWACCPIRNFVSLPAVFMGQTSLAVYSVLAAPPSGFECEATPSSALFILRFLLWTLLFLMLYLSFLMGGKELKNAIKSKVNYDIRSFKGESANLQFVSLFGNDYVLSSLCRESFLL